MKNLTTKKTIFWILSILLLIVAIILFFQDNSKMEETKNNIEEISMQMNLLKEKINKFDKEYADIKNDSIANLKNNQLSELKNDLAELNYKLSEQIDRNHETIKGLWTHQIEYWALVIAILVSIAFFSSLEHLAKEKMEKEIAKISGKDIETIKSNYDEYIKHRNLRKNSKIVILAKDNNFDEVFKKIMALFYVDLENDVVIVENPQCLKKADYDKLKNAGVVLIENYDEKNYWNVKDDSDIINAFIEIGEKISNNTSIFYYGIQGKGFFPSEQTRIEIRHLISFANTPPQLYGNLLNLLKYRYELGIGTTK